MKSILEPCWKCCLLAWPSSIIRASWFIQTEGMLSCAESPLAWRLGLKPSTLPIASVSSIPGIKPSRVANHGPIHIGLCMPTAQRFG